METLGERIEISRQSIVELGEKVADWVDPKIVQSLIHLTKKTFVTGIMISEHPGTVGLDILFNSSNIPDRGARRFGVEMDLHQLSLLTVGVDLSWTDMQGKPFDQVALEVAQNIRRPNNFNPLAVIRFLD